MEEDICNKCQIQSDKACEGDILSLQDLDETKRLQVEQQTSATCFCQLHLDQQLKLFRLYQTSCCDPSGGHKKIIRNQLCDVTDEFYQTIKSALPILPGQELCRNCMYTTIPNWLKDFHEIANRDSQVSHTSSTQSQEQALSGTPHSSAGFDAAYQLDDAKEKIMEIQNILELPDPRLEVTSKRSVNESSSVVVKSVAKKMRLFNSDLEVPNLETGSRDAADFEEIIGQLKEKLPLCKSTREKYLLLSILPKSWTAYQIQTRMGISKYMANRLKKLVEDQGILCLVPSKTNRPLDRNTLRKIEEFYSSDEISRIMPGVSDCVTYTVDGKKVESQIRLMLCNLKEGYQKFKDDNPDLPVGFSSFADARPLYIKLAGASGTHTVCVCKIHQNFKLLLHGLDLGSIDEENKGWTHHDILSRMMCNPPTLQCYFGKCESCPGPDVVIDDIKSLVERESIEQVTFKQWTNTDRSQLETLTQPVVTIIGNLKKTLKDLLAHDFLAKQQAQFFKKKRESLAVGEALAIGNFSQNLAFTIQDEVQEHHWTNDQCTIHPWVVYFRNSQGELEHLSSVMVTDRLEHDVATVYTFQKYLVKILKEKIGNFRKIIYMSDGAAGQYKRPNPDKITWSKSKKK